MHRKTRRFTYFMSLYQQFAGKDDHLDIFSMKKLLVDQQKRLLQLIYFYRDNRFDLPMIKRDYEKAYEQTDYLMGTKKSDRRYVKLEDSERRDAALHILHDLQIDYLKRWRKLTKKNTTDNELLNSLLLTVNAISGGLKSTG